MPAKSIMIQGTMSNAGKSVLAAGLCRIFRQDGCSVAPFKSQNMALNSFITREGLEMGRAQVMQAEAAGVEPSVRMNPILLKPNSDTGSQVIVNGEVLGDMRAADYFRYKRQLVPQILEAYRVLSDPDRRAEYDRKLKGRHSVMQTFDLRESADAGEDGGETGFVTYWKSANDLYDIICESDLLFKEHHRSPRLAKLSMDAIRHVLTLRGAQIPERYWHPDIMNWLLFTWYKNRNITISYLLTLYDEHVKKSVSALDRLRLQKKSYHFQHSVKRLVKY